MPRLLLCFLLALSASFSAGLSAELSAQAQRPRMHGYFTSWSVYARNFHVPDVDAGKLTHLIYAFAKVENGRIALGDPYADIDRFYPGDSWSVGALRGSFRRMQLLKAAQPGLRTLISIGGANSSQGFSSAVVDAASRGFFVSSIVDFVVRYDFDGVDIDWEWPGDGSNAQDPANFVLFLADLRRAIDARGRALSRSYEISVNVPADPARAARLDIAKVAASADALQLVSFDYFVPIANLPNPVSHLVAPLRAIPGDPTPPPYRDSFNVEATVALYRAKCPPEKLVLGVPFYGRGYAGIVGGTNGLFAQYSGPTSSGTWGPGVYDATDLFANYVGKAGFVRYWEPDARVPRLYDAAQGVMISYEDARSVREKAWLSASRGLGGMMAWELSADRGSVLLGEIDGVLRGPKLSSPVVRVSVASPSAVPLRHEAGSARAGKLYMLFASLSGNAPGIPLPGGVLPIQFDAFTNFVLSAANSPLFPGSVGFTDATGSAALAVDFGLLPSLPRDLIGQRLTCATWTFDALAAVQGAPSNAVELLFVP